MALRYEGVRFSDGSIAVRRISADPCERSSRTFESLRELEDDIGSGDVTWLADRGPKRLNPAVEMLHGYPRRKPALAVVGCKRDPSHPEPIMIETAEDWRRVMHSEPPEWFLEAPTPPLVVPVCGYEPTEEVEEP